MTDVLTPAQRRFNMSRIRGTNTKPELLLRSALHAAGLRFRLHKKDLPGRPDIVFPAAHIAVFVDGCFWHGCPAHGAKPKTNDVFWRKKLAANRKRDARVVNELKQQGWKVLRIWEHDIKNKLQRVTRSIERTVQKTRKSR